MRCDELPTDLVERLVSKDNFPEPHDPRERTIFGLITLLRPSRRLRLGNEGVPKRVTLAHEERLVLELFLEPLLQRESRSIFLDFGRQALAAIARRSKKSAAALNHAEGCRNFPFLGVRGQAQVQVVHETPKPE